MKANMKNNLNVIFFVSLCALSGNAFGMHGVKGNEWTSKEESSANSIARIIGKQYKGEAFQRRIAAKYAGAGSSADTEPKSREHYEKQLNTAVQELMPKLIEDLATTVQKAQREGRSFTTEDLMFDVSPKLELLLETLKSTGMPHEIIDFMRKRLNEVVTDSIQQLLSTQLPEWQINAQMRIGCEEIRLMKTEERVISVEEIVDIMIKELTSSFAGPIAMLAESEIAKLREQLTASTIEKLPDYPLTKIASQSAP